MAKLPDNTLFELISSLSRHEKRYVRVNFEGEGKGTRRHLEELYDRIASQQSYNEQAIKMDLEGTSLGKQFAVYKNLLYKALLRILQSYHYEKSPESAVRSGMEKVSLLIERGMAEAAVKMIRKTRKLALEYSLNSYLPILSRLERRVLRRSDPLGFADQLAELQERDRQAHAEIEVEQEAIELYDQLFAWIQVERRMEKAGISSQLAETGQRLAYLESRAVKTFGAKSALLSARALQEQLSGNYEAMMSAHTNLLALWESHPKLTSAFPKRYAAVLIAWLNSSLATGKVGEHIDRIRSLRRLPVEKQSYRARLVFQSYNLELLWLMQQKSPEQAIGFLPQFEQRLGELKPHLDELWLTSYYLNGAFLYFRVGEYEKVLSWTRRLQTADFRHRSSFFHRSAFLVSIVCQLEVGDFRAAESALRSLKRRLQLGDADWDFGKRMAESLRQLCSKWGTDEQAILQRALLEELEEIEAQATPVPFSLDLLKGWAAKIP